MSAVVRADYAPRIVATVSPQLPERFGRGFDMSSWHRMVTFSQTFPNRCTETSRDQVELLEMHQDGIVVAEYWTALPPKAELEARIREIYLAATGRVARREIANAAEQEESE